LFVTRSEIFSVEGCGKSGKASRRTNASVGYVSVVLAEMEKQIPPLGRRVRSDSSRMTGLFAPEPGLSFLVLSRKGAGRAGKNLTAKQKRELSALAAMSEDQIDTSDIPELPPAAWKDAVRGRLYRPVKQAVSMRLDADVVAWLKKAGKGYQTRANRILRQRMLDEIRRT
jgi:uncharacterized protein (DUF4415 family)